MNVRPIRQTAPESRSEQREKLAEALEDLRQLNAEIAAIKDAIASTEAARRRGEGALETANVKIGEAKTAAADAMVAKALGRASGTPADVTKLRLEAAAAQDEIDAAVAAQSHLKTKLGEAEYRLTFARGGVDKAWPEVVKSSPELARLLRDYATTARTYATMLDIFHNGVPAEVYNERLVLPQPDREVAATWKAAIEALKKNADASLP
jgi:chromosome segregation ATPase